MRKQYATQKSSQKKTSIERMFYGFASCVLLSTASGAAFADSSATVKVDALKVKERLRSMEQINVTAEKEQQVVTPISEAVADLLREADVLDAEKIEKEAD